MDQRHKDLIARSQPELIRAIADGGTLTSLMDHLGQKDANGDYGLTPSNISSIRGGHHTDEDEKVRKFLSTICTRGPNAFNRLLLAIVKADETALIEIFNSHVADVGLALIDVQAVRRHIAQEEAARRSAGTHPVAP